MARLDGLAAAIPAAADVFFAVMAEPITATTCRYVREDNGQLGGPIAYQRLRAAELVAETNDGGDNANDHTHTRHPTLPAAGSRCLVVITNGAMQSGMAFPETLS